MSDLKQTHSYPGGAQKHIPRTFSCFEGTEVTRVLPCFLRVLSQALRILLTGRHSWTVFWRQPRLQSLPSEKGEGYIYTLHTQPTPCPRNFTGDGELALPLSTPQACSSVAGVGHRKSSSLGTLAHSPGCRVWISQGRWGNGGCTS